MSSSESDLREQICFWGKSLFDRGLTAGSSGNLSARLDDGFLVTPTGSCLGTLEPAALTKLDQRGRLLSGSAPTKEAPMHLAAYRARPTAGGVVHLHSTYATALSCLTDVDREDALTPVTPYPSMLFGSVAIVSYFPPGSEELGAAAGEAMRTHSAILLANHGSIVAAATFRSAVFAAEELEEAARLSLVLRAHEHRVLDAAALAHLRRR